MNAKQRKEEAQQRAKERERLMVINILTYSIWRALNEMEREWRQAK